MAAEKKAKPTLHRVRMQSPDGERSRTIELLAESEDRARRTAERQADDIAEQDGSEPYEVVSIEAL